MTTPNLWDPAKAVIKVQFITIKSYHSKQEKSQINNINLHIKLVQKGEQQKTKLTEGKKADFEKLNKIYKPLARLIKKKGRGLKS